MNGGATYLMDVCEEGRSLTSNARFKTRAIRKYIMVTEDGKQKVLFDYTLIRM